MEFVQLRKKARELPARPGVYIMKNKRGKVIYVGKAKVLKNRVSSYFTGVKSHTQKVMQMVLNIDDFDFIVTDTEVEALMLENSLIKQYMPKYNILLKDDKGYPFIKLNLGDAYPRFELAAKAGEDKKARYFGPYPGRMVVKQIIDTMEKAFQLPSCKKVFPRDMGKGRPCLNHFIGQCIAPCTGNVSQTEYKELIDEAIAFLEGGHKKIEKALEEKMNRASEAMEFETAARYRDRLAALRRIRENQKVVFAEGGDMDVVSMYRDEHKACFVVLVIREGLLLDKQSFLFDSYDVQDLKQAYTEFFSRYFSSLDMLPRQILTDVEIEEKEVFEQYLTHKAQRRVYIKEPKRGNYSKLVMMANQNAKEIVIRSTDIKDRRTRALRELSDLLGSEALFHRIEAYDISNISGAANVAGMVVFENGVAKHADYRRFSIKTLDGPDDYAAMKEVISRRMARLVSPDEKKRKGFDQKPDLILLDGGMGHVTSVEPIVRAYGLGIPVVGMVKNDKHKTRALVTLAGEISFYQSQRAMSLIYQIQEEVHRYAISYHRQKHTKNSFASELTEIPGIGKTRATNLMRHFKSMKAIREADRGSLAIVPGMNEQAAERVYRYFREKE